MAPMWHGSNCDPKAMRESTGSRITLVVAQEVAEKLKRQLAGDGFVSGGREWSTMRTVLRGTLEFLPVDRSDQESLQHAMKGADLVVHLAGPFQFGEPEVLQAAIATQTPYMDVSDDLDYGLKCKQLSKAAAGAGIAAVTTCGIYPGLSNIMAASLVRMHKEETGEVPSTIEFAYFTAGTGGVGPTILEAMFLLMAKDALVYEDAQAKHYPPLSLQKEVDFGSRGPGIGKRRTMCLNLPEVRSAHEVLGVPNVSAYFGTSPDFWNLLLLAMAAFLPRTLLNDRRFVQQLASATLPVNRLVDVFAGSAAGIRIDIKDEANRILRTGLWTGKYLSQATGRATAAMALELLELQRQGGLSGGVWYPEEVMLGSVESEQRFLSRAVGPGAAACNAVSLAPR